MKVFKTLMLTAALSGIICGPALAQMGNPFPWCTYLQIPDAAPAKQNTAPGAAPAATPAPQPPATPAATPPAATPPAGTPAATPPADETKDDGPKVPNIVELLKQTTDAKDIVDQILSAAAPLKPEEFDQAYDSTYEKIVEMYIEPSRIAKLSEYKDKYRGQIKSWSDLDKAIGDLIAAVGDRWTWYHGPVEKLTNDINHNVHAVFFGSHLRQQADGTYVVEFLEPGSTAQTVGIREGDLILSINDKELKGLSKLDAEQLENRTEGDQLHIVSIQDGQRVDDTYTLHSPAKDAEDPKAEVIFDNLAYIKLPSFMNEKLYGQLKDALFGMDATIGGGLQGMILDLRYNGGGRVDMAKDLIAMLEDRGVVLHERKRDKRLLVDETTTILPTPEIMNSLKTPQEIVSANHLHEIPLVILINGSSASASEIVTGALGEARSNTMVMGERSFGKGVEMVIMPTPTCGQMAITSAAYTTPSGQWLHNVGIEPKIVVHQVRGSPDDVQLQAAVKWLKDKTALNGAVIADKSHGDDRILGTPAERPVDQVKPKSWLDSVAEYRGLITRVVVGGVLLLIFVVYMTLSRRANKDKNKKR